MADEKKCSACRYWAEFLAKRTKGETRQAPCLNATSKNYNAGTNEHEKCPQWASATKR